MVNNNDNAHVRAGILKDGESDANLSDGSEAGDWRLPIKKELVGITTGNEAVSSSQIRAFSGVQENYYWSSSTNVNDTTTAWVGYLGYSYVYSYDKTHKHYVWPVRGGQ